jgi:hypothetical protein
MESLMLRCACARVLVVGVALLLLGVVVMVMHCCTVAARQQL